MALGGADGLVRETISWMVSLSFSLCNGLEMPISRWISVSDRADMIAPDFTLALQAATYLQRKMTTLFKIRFVDELVVENTVLTKQRNSQYK